MTFMKLRFMKSPSFAKQNSYCYYAVRGLGNAERSQELKPYEPEADNTDGGNSNLCLCFCQVGGAFRLNLVLLFSRPWFIILYKEFIKTLVVFFT